MKSTSVAAAAIMIASAFPVYSQTQPVDVSVSMIPNIYMRAIAIAASGINLDLLSNENKYDVWVRNDISKGFITVMFTFRADNNLKWSITRRGCHGPAGSKCFNVSIDEKTMKIHSIEDE